MSESRSNGSKIGSIISVRQNVSKGPFSRVGDKIRSGKLGRNGSRIESIRGLNEIGSLADLFQDSSSDCNCEMEKHWNYDCNENGNQ